MTRSIVRALLGALLLAAVLVPLGAGPATAAATPSGCGTDRTSGTRLRSVDVDGWRRQYHLSVPPHYTGDQRVPLVVDLHGAGSNGVEEAALTQMRQQAGARGWVVVTPESGRGIWLPVGLTHDDSDFIRAVVQDVGKRLCIDAHRRFATGISNGAGMSSSMTCLGRRVFAAIAPVAGVNLFADCPSNGPVPVIAFHGDADPVIPFEGGTINGNGPGGGLPVPAVADRMTDWAARNQCTGGPVVTDFADTVVQYRYTGCAAPVKWFQLEGGGHTWPGSLDIPRLGPTNHEIDATAQIVAFFSHV